MPSRLYLRNIPASQPGAPIGTATTDEDYGHVGASRLVCLTISKTKGNADVDVNYAGYGAHPGGVETFDLMRLYISPALAAQTLTAGQHFTVAGAFTAAGPDVNWSLRTFVYLWRPGIGYVTTLFSDGTSRNGVTDGDEGSNWPSAVWRSQNHAALSGDVEVRLRDRIVVEVWGRNYWDDPITQHVLHWHYNGNHDEYDDGDYLATPDAASYLEYSGDLILAQEATMNSANILVGARDLQVDGADVGALDGGATVTYEPTHIEHAVDQRMGVQRVDKIAERMTITAHLKEATLENLRIAWGQPASALSTSGTKTTLNVGGEEAVTEHLLVLTGKAPGTNRTRAITCHKAVAIETSAHSYTKEGATVYPVTFVLVEDPTQDEGFKYMTIEDDEGQFRFS